MLEWERNKNRIEIDSVDCGAYIKKKKVKHGLLVRFANVIALRQGGAGV
jgi:hypothetical protein